MAEKISSDTAGITMKGTVVYWNESRGFGFAAMPVADLTGDIFLHHTECPGLPGHRNLKKGQEIEFEVTIDDSQRFRARNVRIIETKETSKW